MNLDIKSNEKVCLTGSNGSGKATLLKLMSAFYEPDIGNIIYDQVPVKNHDITELRKVIGECITDDRIFEGTLMDNLTVGRDINQKRMFEILDNIGLTSFINQLPLGYSTQIGPQGKRLPGSVLQKIILARNLLKEPRLLIVEDIFKNVEKTEKIKSLNTS
ncbi:MAG: ATP-binding cassette domain-containing protein [Saprospiraceae bacterium]|nr:ATP-binding cassette domain-containing protein [Saprospiraceae bacterium]